MSQLPDRRHVRRFGLCNERLRCPSVTEAPYGDSIEEDLQRLTRDVRQGDVKVSDLHHTRVRPRPTRDRKAIVRDGLLDLREREARTDTPTHTHPAPAEQPHSHAQAPAKDDLQRPHTGTGTHCPGASSLRARRAGQRRIPGRN